MSPNPPSSKRIPYIDKLFGERVRKADEIRRKNEAKARAEVDPSAETEMQKWERGVQVRPSGG